MLVVRSWKVPVVLFTASLLSEALWSRTRLAAGSAARSPLAAAVTTVLVVRERARGGGDR